MDMPNHEPNLFSGLLNKEGKKINKSDVNASKVLTNQPEGINKPTSLGDLPNWHQEEAVINSKSDFNN